MKTEIRPARRRISGTEWHYRSSDRLDKAVGLIIALAALTILALDIKALFQ